MSSLGFARDSIDGLSNLWDGEEEKGKPPPPYGTIPEHEEVNVEEVLNAVAAATNTPPAKSADANKSVASKSNENGAASRTGESTTPPGGNNKGRESVPRVEKKGDGRKVQLQMLSSEERIEQKKRQALESNPNAYAGFTMEYSEYANYYNDNSKESSSSAYYDFDPYAPTVLGEKTGSSRKGGFLCCLFPPWMAGAKVEQDDRSLDDQKSGASEVRRSRLSFEGSTTDEEEEKKGNEGDGVAPETEASSIASSRDGDASSTDTDAYGEPLTDKDRLAVLARLRLSQPDAPAATPSKKKEKGLLNEISTFDGKETGDSKQDAEGTDATTVEDAATPSESSSLQVKAPTKGILKRPSMQKVQQALLASQSSGSVANAEGDGKPRRSLFPKYEPRQSSMIMEDESEETPHQGSGKSVRFSPMARVVTITSRKSMTFIDRSQVWWQKSDYEDFKKAGRIIARALLEGGSEIWLMSKSRRNASSVRRSRSADASANISRQVPGERSGEDVGSKWWCKFGHSRRGLEHIASMEEGKQRQKNVNVAIAAVINEQRRQRINGMKDPKKLSQVQHQYSSWARDLSLAAGAADAEAVRSNFDQDAKGREHYLMKQATGGAGTPVGQRPPFMVPSDTSQQLLDANTRTSIMYRRQQQKIRNGKAGAAPVSEAAPLPELTEEAIHDPGESHENIAKKAAGYGYGDEGTGNMAAVLSGMGAVDNAVAQTRATRVGAA